MGRKKPPMAAQAPMRNAGRRAQSAGRLSRNRFEDEDDDDDRYNQRSNSVGRLDQRRGREKSRMPRGLRTQARKVSISRYVERIDIPPPGPKRSIAPPMSRGRSRSVSVGARGRSRSRSSSIGRKQQRSKSKRRLFSWGKKKKERRDEGFSSDESSIGSWSVDSKDEDDTYF